jgi:hypothetical protein
VIDCSLPERIFKLLWVAQARSCLRIKISVNRRKPSPRLIDVLEPLRLLLTYAVLEDMGTVSSLSCRGAFLNKQLAS